jgi:hypothetical protein
MMSIQEVIREMREYAEHLRSLGTSRAVFAVSFCRWADALEVSMREPVGHRGEYGGVLNERGVALPLDTKLYAFPPDAATVIRLEVEHSRMLVEEIERLSVAFRLMANQKLPHEMNSEDREFADWQHAYTACVLIARTALAKEEDK